MLKDARNRAAQPLFKFGTENGNYWLFVILPDHRWMITHNANRVAAGTSDRAGIAAAVEKFLSLTRVAVVSDAACDPAVAAQLDRIQRGRSVALKVANSQGRTRPYAPHRSSAFLPTYGIAVS